PLIQLLLAENLRRELLKRLGFLRNAGSHHLHLALFRLVLRPQRRGEHQPGERSHTLRILASVSMKLYPRTMIRSFRDAAPRIALSAYIDRSAQVIGDVTIGERSSVWPNCSIRGDIGPIRIGDDCNVQDNTAMHLDDGFPLTLGDRVTIGH